MEVVCPAGVGEGDTVTVETPDGRTVTVVVPANVSEGATFIVNDVERDYVDIWFNIVAREVTSKTQADLDLEHIQKQMQVPIIRN